MKIILTFILFNLSLIDSQLIDGGQQILQIIKEAVDFVLGLIKGDPKEVCYEEYKVGCFSTDGPLGHIHTLPQHPNIVDVKFFLYTKNAPQTKREIHYLRPETLNYIPRGSKIAFTIHGFNSKAAEFNEIKNALIQTEYETIITVDWEKGSRPPTPFLKIIANTELIGRQVAVLANKAINTRDINPKNMYIVGHSFGAHIAGFAGKWSTQEYKWKFGRITALEAAAPLFEGFPGSYVTYEDAEFVDSIHTSIGGNILIGQVGFNKPFAHVDFYPNGGSEQPRCKLSLEYFCNHLSANNYYIASIIALGDCKFMADKCHSYTDFKLGKCFEYNDSMMGYGAVYYRGRGKHYLKTTDEYPFCDVKSK